VQLTRDLLAIGKFLYGYSVEFSRKTANINVKMFYNNKTAKILNFHHFKGRGRGYNDCVRYQLPLKRV